jgi:hypothetical protein
MSGSVKNPKRPAHARGTTTAETKKRQRSRSNSPERPAKKPALEKDTVMEGAVELPPEPTTPHVPEITKRNIRVREPVEELPSDPDDEGTLRSLLMQTGELKNLLGGPDGGWPGIAAKLSDTFMPEERDPDDEPPIAKLGTVYYQPGMKGKIVADEDGVDLGKQDMLTTIRFLNKFMNANGQWDYIKKQDWFKVGGDYAIAIDVNYYPDRTIYDESSPGFHKDTAGDNIFVNLIFDNKSDIEKTEWFADAAEPSKKRAAWQEKLLPESHLRELARARETLRQEAEKNAKAGLDNHVDGGISKGKYIYVSWVDDLVWHATPADPRKEYTVKDSGVDYPMFDSAYHYEQPSQTDILKAIGGSPATFLHDLLQENNLVVGNIDDAMTEEIMEKVYGDEDGAVDYDNDVKASPAEEMLANRKTQLNAARRGVEILGTIAELEGTHLNTWLRDQEPSLRAQDLDQVLAKVAWQKLYEGNEGRARYDEDVEKRATDGPWRVTGGPSEAVAEVRYLPDSSSLKELPRDLSKRRRRASLDYKEILKLRKANEDVPRTFLRTWVRLVRKDSDEAQEVGLAQ